MNINGLPIIRLENKSLQIDICPSVGGRIINILNKPLDYQFLWHNSSIKLKRNKPGSEYNPAFYGGIDDILPTDIPEYLNGIDYPDHGEVWTTDFEYTLKNGTAILSGYLPLLGFNFEKTISLRNHTPYIDIDYKIKNKSQDNRTFLWRLHAALKIKAGDRIICPAGIARAADQEWSRLRQAESFIWPEAPGYKADLIPEADGSSEFLFLDDLKTGTAGWERPSEKLSFKCTFDTAIFPAVCYFASFGKLNGCYTAVIEPSTINTVSVKEAEQTGKAPVLEPDEELKTRISLYAGRVK